MSEWDRLAAHFAAPHHEVQLQRLGLAVLGDGLFASRYKNLLHVGSLPQGVVLRLQTGILAIIGSGPTQTLFIPWQQVARGEPPALSLVPQETWLLGPDRIPLTVAAGAIRPPL